MKIIIAALVALSANYSAAREIEGIQMLKGSLKTEVRVKSIKTTCKVKVEDVKNLMEEDRYGNPAYKVKVQISLNGGDFLSAKKIRYDKEVMMNNLFADGVRDFEYQGEGIKLKIDSDGRLVEVRIPYQQDIVTCYF